MSSYKQILYHLVIGTKNREQAINEEHCEDLYKYIMGIAKEKECHIYRINGVEDHIHIISDLHPSIALADYIKTIKVASNIWMKENSKFHLFKGWGAGYGAFTCSWQDKDKVIQYVNNQKEHHKKESHADEYRRILSDFGVEFDEKYLF